MLHPMKTGTFRVSSGFGPRGGSLHRGIDYAAPLGTPIYSAENGFVEDSRDEVGGFGCWIVVRHWINNRHVSTVYGHMRKADLLVRKGQRVSAGQQISRVGNEGQSSGPHLHFEVWVGGRFNGGIAVDPAPWIKGIAPAPIKPPAFPVLQRGDSGTAVLKLQEFMTENFSSYNAYTPTGDFGPLTEYGVMEFQRRVGTADDGVVGSQTLALLMKYGFKP